MALVVQLLSNSCLGEGRIESPNTRKVIALKTAQRGVCRDEGEHYSPAYIGMQQTQQVTDLVKGDGLDVESARGSINPSALLVIVVQRYRETAHDN